MMNQPQNIVKKALSKSLMTDHVLFDADKADSLSFLLLGLYGPRNEKEGLEVTKKHIVEDAMVCDDYDYEMVLDQLLANSYLCRNGTTGALSIGAKLSIFISLEREVDAKINDDSKVENFPENFVVKELSEDLKKCKFENPWVLSGALLKDFSSIGSTEDFNEDDLLQMGACGSGSYYSLLKRLMQHKYIILEDDRLQPDARLNIFLMRQEANF